MIFVDTDVVVDLLRGVPSAQEWLSSHREEQVLLSGFVVMELVAGCRDREEQRRLSGFVGAFSVSWPDAAACARALDLFLTHRLSGGIGMVDSFVAAQAIQLGVALCSFNEKHYAAVRELRVTRPYTRP